MEAQFDSRSRAAGHSYTKYNDWETVGGARGLHIALKTEPTTSH